MGKQIITGNEAIARGAYEAGAVFASAYPGTPSTEILENMTNYDEIISEWAPNEKVAMEAVIGAAVAGGRSIASMKHVGVNVAADPLMTAAYTGINAGMVVVSADEPGQFSSQNEQDNRNYAKFAKIPMLEPSDSQETIDMTKAAFEISEEFDVPVMIRLTTRVCHSKSLVELQSREQVALKPYVKDAKKYVMVPANAKVRRVFVEQRMQKLREYTEKSVWNRAEYNSGKNGKIGVITSGMCYQYAKEVFGDDVSYLKLGFTNPLPANKIKTFCENMEKVYVIEENDPYIEDFVNILGIKTLGKDIFPAYGEKTPDVIRKCVFGERFENAELDHSDVVARPPAMCAGCPHRGFFYDLSRRKDILVSGDIGCYTLGFMHPYNSMDWCICMGAAFSAGHAAQKVLDLNEDNKMKVVSVLGDSTFFHSGINSLIEVAYNGSNTVNVILDNRITGMTGHQENPGSGYTARREPTDALDIEAMVRACGIKHIRVINPNDLELVKETMDWALELDEPSVIITKWPCLLKKFSQEDIQQFPTAYTGKYRVDEQKCIGCKICLRSGCPAISYNAERNVTEIDRAQCVGCSVCAQICPVDAILKEEKND